MRTHITVWMHKGGDIILLYPQQYYTDWCECENANKCTMYYRAEFFEQHCVYIGVL